ncbi:MAG: SAM-dependent methyltransferase [Ruminococcus flavefaciens]|nr:SAM-dependent methyltransferase [Ruminococcus flavefaciens]MCM1061729.1 SAM-dependent methyltransferase [Eubacterium sp.]
MWVLSKNKREERKGKIQLINAGTIFHKLRKALGNKKNEISPEDRSVITKLYADFEENEFCKIYNNTEFIYREYTIMQPLQRSYMITEQRIQLMISKRALDSLYNQVKFEDLELLVERSGKEQKQLDNYFLGKPVYDAIVEELRTAISDKVWLSLTEFIPELTNILSKSTTDKRLIDKIADGLSVMDKSAEIQRDKKGNILYDKETKETEIVKYDENIEDYMAREVLPHIPDARWFFEEDLGKKNPVIKTGAEIPFTRYFYKYQQPKSSEELKQTFLELEKSVSERIARLFG